MDPQLIREARELGWPVRVSYGMTEASSQVATAKGEEVDWLPVLPSWNLRKESDGRLAIQGEPLFSGYARKTDCGWRYDSGKTDQGWFVTGDRCEVKEGRLRFLGRADDLVKISGELVSVSAIENRATLIAHQSGTDAAVVAIADERRGGELVLVVEKGKVSSVEVFSEINQQLEGIERLNRLVEVVELPRTSIGKLDRSALEDVAGR